MSPNGFSNHVKLDFVNGGPVYNRTYEVAGFSGVFMFNGSVGCAAASSKKGITLGLGGTGDSTDFTWMAYVWSQGFPGVIGSIGRCPGGPPIPAGDCVGAEGYTMLWDAGYEDFSYANGVITAYPTALYSPTWANAQNATWCAQGSSAASLHSLDV